MADNFADAIAILADELHEPEDDINLRRALVRSLRHHRSMNFLFSERSTVLTLQAGVWQYGIADGLPGDILKIKALTLQTDVTSTQFIPLEGGQVSVQEMRRLHSSANATGYPEWWTIFAEQLWLYPTPSGAYLLNMDLHSDFTRDEGIGGIIGIESDEATNVFIQDGEEALISRAAYTYSLAIQRDTEKAQQFKAVHEDAVKNLMRERDLMKLAGAQVRAYGL